MRRFLPHAVLATSVVIAVPALLVWSLLPSRGAYMLIASAPREGSKYQTWSAGMAITTLVAGTACGRKRLIYASPHRSVACPEALGTVRADNRPAAIFGRIDERS